MDILKCNPLEHQNSLLTASLPWLNVQSGPLLQILLRDLTKNCSDCGPAWAAIHHNFQNNPPKPRIGELWQMHK